MKRLKRISMIKLLIIFGMCLGCILTIWLKGLVCIITEPVDCTPSQEHQEVMQRLDTLEQGQTYLIDLLNNK